ncbi:MAG: putative short-chain dehydrogenase/reductase [Porticoccaceae bacterium]|nr:MAG: putative short-chain dehydrogenase/reductase [Porticoccaceae bacterium]
MTFSLDQFRLDGKVAVVTGAGGRGRSIGRAYALGLASAGAAVVVADRDGAGAERVAGEVEAAGGRALPVAVDVADPASVAALAERVRAAFGGVDILVNNAALMVEVAGDDLLEMPLERWQRLFEVNLTGALLCVRALVASMRERGGGRIVNQVSGGAFPALSAYGVSKLALVGLTTALAKRLGPDGITVNAIAPGNVTSDAGRALVPDDSPFLQLLRAMVAARPRGEPEELVGPLLLLCSPAGGWITGQVLHVDGGWVMRP